MIDEVISMQTGAYLTVAITEKRYIYLFSNDKCRLISIDIDTN